MNSTGSNPKKNNPQPIYLLPEEYRFILKEIVARKDRDGLHEWIRLVFGVYIPRQKICPDHDAPFDFIADFIFDLFETAVVLANRSGGKTYDFAILDAIESFLLPELEIATVGAIEQQAKRCYKYFSDYIDKEPFLSNVDSKTMSKTTHRNRSSVEVLVGTMSGVNCLSGDTLIDLPRNLSTYPDGIPIRDLVGKEFYTYSYDTNTNT